MTELEGLFEQKYRELHMSGRPMSSCFSNATARCLQRVLMPDLESILHFDHSSFPVPWHSWWY